MTGDATKLASNTARSRSVVLKLNLADPEADLALNSETKNDKSQSADSQIQSGTDG